MIQLTEMIQKSSCWTSWKAQSTTSQLFSNFLNFKPQISFSTMFSSFFSFSEPVHCEEAVVAVESSEVGSIEVEEKEAAPVEEEEDEEEPEDVSLAINLWRLNLRNNLREKSEYLEFD